MPHSSAADTAIDRILRTQEMVGDRQVNRVRLVYALAGLGMVVGDAVNLASRLEALTRELGCKILVDDATCAAVAPWVEARALPPTPIRGLRDAVAVHAIDPGSFDPVRLAELRRRLDDGGTQADAVSRSP